jgi:hypothetical protein
MFILHGGIGKEVNCPSPDFYATILSRVNKVLLNIVCVYFARPSDNWKSAFEKDKSNFKEVNRNKTLNIKMAKSKTAEFEKQLESADIILISGGRKGNLREKLMAIARLRQIFSDKVVVGISAGANALSTFYYSPVAAEVREGIGILPIKLFCHYNKEFDKELNLLRSHGDKDLPVITLGEGEYKTFVN